MAEVGIHDFRNTRGIRNLAPSQQNGDPVVHQQLGAGYNPNVILSGWTPGAAVSNSTAEVLLSSYSIGGAGFQVGTQWEGDAGWTINYLTGTNMAANFRILLDGTAIATNENNAITIPSSANTKSCVCEYKIVAISATQLLVQKVFLRVGVGITVDPIDQGNTWDHTGLALVTVPDLTTARTLTITFQAETASANFIVTPFPGSLRETRPNGSISGGSPGGNTNEVQYRDASGNFAGAANVEIISGNLALGIVVPPAAAPTGFVIQSARGGADYAQIPIVLYTTELGGAHLESPFLGLRQNIANWFAAAGGQPIQTQGCSIAATGTSTAAFVSGTNVYTRTPRVEYLVTTASTTAVAGLRENAILFSIGGPSAELGGFIMRMVAGPATGVSTLTSRFFMGVGVSIAAPTDVEPSSIQNILGFGYDSTDTNINLMHRGLGVVTKVDLGPNFPVPTTDRSAMYTMLLNALPGTTQTVHYAFTNLTNGITATGTITTNLPLTSSYLARRVWSSVGGTSSVIGVAVGPSELRFGIA